MTGGEADCPPASGEADDGGDCIKSKAESCMLEVREWLRDQHHLPQNIEDSLMLSFVMGCKLNLAIIKKRLDAYYSVRNSYREFYAVRDPEERSLIDARSIIYNFRIKRCTFEGYDALFVGMKSALYGGEHGLRVQDHYLGMFKAMLVSLDALLLEDPRADQPRLEDRCCYYIVVDLKGTAMSYILNLPPITLARLKKCILDVYPLRLKRVIYFNTPYVVEMAMNKVVMPLVKKKIADRMNFYSTGAECLTKHFPLEILPEEFGGKNKTVRELDREHTEEILGIRDWFMGAGSTASDESKRMKKHDGCVIS